MCPGRVANFHVIVVLSPHVYLVTIVVEYPQKWVLYFLYTHIHVSYIPIHNTYRYYNI